MTTISQEATPDPYAPLIDKFNAWLAETGYKPMSADELLHELLVDESSNADHRRWLSGFIAEWEAVAKPELPLDFDASKKIVLDLARQNLAPEDMPELRARQIEACDTIEELAVNFHETN